MNKVASDKEWRTAIAKFGISVEGTPDEVVERLCDEYAKIEMGWREEIEKYLPQMSVMSFIGARSTIKWLMDKVTINSADKELADKLNAIKDSFLSEKEKSNTKLQAIFPNLGPCLD